MGLYNFDARFAPFIRDGRKRHTIRAHRAYADVPGATLHLYTGLRTRGAMLLFRAPCVRVEEIRIGGFGQAMVVNVDGRILDSSEEELLAQRDGFENFIEMIDYWEGRLPFEGQIIHWDFEKRRME